MKHSAAPSFRSSASQAAAATTVRTILSTCLLGLCASCLPSRYAYVRVPVRAPVGPVVVDVPLAWLQRHSEDFAPERLVFYGKSRAPLRHRLVDTDADGIADHARVALEVYDDRTQLTVIGADADADVLHQRIPLEATLEPTPDAVLDMDRSVRKR